MELSVIIPTLNEEKQIGFLIKFLKNELKNVAHEIIVSDGNSSDKTVLKAKELGVIVIKGSQMSRSIQMNEAAKRATGHILYFLHADAIPPSGFYKCIKNSIEQGFELGCFRFKFNSDLFLLKINSFLTRFKGLMFRGGDQTLYIHKTAFKAIGGFNPKYRIMEDYEFILRAKREYSFKIIQEDVIVSARKYKENSYLRVNFANLVVFSLFRWRCSQELMLKAYRNLLNHPKSISLKELNEVR